MNNILQSFPLAITSQWANDLVTLVKDLPSNHVYYHHGLRFQMKAVGVLEFGVMPVS